MKNFENEWILDEIAQHHTFLTKRMFGGLAVYLFMESSHEDFESTMQSLVKRIPINSHRPATIA